MNKTWGLMALSVLLLTGCSSAASATPAPSTATSASTPSGKAVPQLVGKTPAEAAKDLTGLDYDVYQKGAIVSSDSPLYSSLVISSSQPNAGEVVPSGSRLKIIVEAPKVATPSAAPKPTGYAATVPAKFPGYPLIVHSATLDYRIKFAMEGKLVDDQVVALAPGLYTPYNPRVTDLSSYYVHTGVYGDSAIKNAYMPEAGGATWPGVLPGPEEPK